MPLTKNSFINLSRSITDDAEELTLWLLSRLRALSNRLINDPDTIIRRQVETRAAIARHERFLQQAKAWIDEELPSAYLKGIQEANRIGEGATLTAGAFAAKGLLIPDVPSVDIAPKAAEILKEVPEHHTIYSAFQRAAYSDYTNTRLPIIRQQQDRIREIIIEASEAAYKDADFYTRRQFSQDLMRRFSDEGITGIRYSNGRTVKLDSYAEMVARTQLNHAAQQASWNRLQEYGIDLVAISSHSPCSPMCYPWQGQPYSLSGKSGTYPPLQDAIDGGVWHPNCKHTTSGYSPGTSLPEVEVSEEENAEMYKQVQKQRYNERKIKEWKRREVSAVDPREREKATEKIKEWQARQRQVITENDFLRRDYSREQI